MDVELLEVRRRDAGVLARDVREDHVPRGLLRGAGKPDHVTDRLALAQHPERPLRDLRGGDDPHVDHRRSVSRAEPRSAHDAHTTGGGARTTRSSSSFGAPACASAKRSLWPRVTLTARAAAFSSAAV